jgi:hypothetical protein
LAKGPLQLPKQKKLLRLRRALKSTVAELSPPQEPFDPLADPKTKEALEIINMAESIVDEVVNKLLNEVAEKILKED